MAEFVNLQNKAVTTGGTVNVPVTIAAGYPECLVSGYRLTGTVTLVSDYELTPSGTAVLNQRVLFYNEAEITLSGNNFVIFGVTVNTALSDKYFVAECLYNGSAWVVTVLPSFAETGVLQTAQIADEAVTLAKVEDLTSAYLIVGNGSNRPTAVAMSGDTTITNAGVVAIAAGVIVNADVNASAGIVVSKLAGSAVTGDILINNVATPTWTAMSGDATISAAGALAIGASKITNTMMADDSVTLTNLASTGEIESLTTSSPTPNSTALTTLASILIPTGSMDTAGDVLSIYAYGTTGATANNKTLTLVLGATTLATNTTTAAPNALNWTIEAKIFYTGAAAQKGYCKFTFNGVASEIDVFTGAETWLANTVYIKGQNGTAAVGEITLEGFQAINEKKNNA